ncbi:MAG: cbb3-type cytochrome c oxidase N-terminal domain-containing protein [Gemmatimonadota bacterium]|jgi:cytochrome c oxidase cbb3-type subunit 3|nr:c-type cytochrome [Gemmatimonadota bacterium]
MSANEHPQQDELLDHNYDGIQEYDNPLPRWWVYLFWATIVLVPVYYVMPGTIGAGGTKERLYALEMEAYRRAHPEPATPSGPDDDGLLAMAKDHERLEEGKETFVANCAACHGPAGGGVIGPNLTDDAWLHGGQPTDIHRTIAEGVIAKGMPPWAKTLKPEQLNDVVAYVLSLRGTNPPNAKAPEGTPATPPASPPAAGGTASGGEPPRPAAGAAGGTTPASASSSSLP